MTHSAIIDITEVNLQQTLEHSMQLPVLLYFWSARSQQCQELTPILDKLANEYNGQFILAKMDCDAQQIIASQFGLRAIPTLYLFKDGQPVDGFQGPQPEEAIREFLSRFLPKAEDIKATEAAELVAQGHLNEALSLLKEAHALDEKRSDISFALADALIRLKRIDEAKAILAKIPLQDQDSQYHGLIAQIELLEQAADSPEIKQLQQEVSTQPDNTDLAIKLALALHQAGRNEEALSGLMGHLHKDFNAAEGNVRKVLMDILAALGNGDALAAKYRRQLYSLMY